MTGCPIEAVISCSKARSEPAYLATLPGGISVPLPIPCNPRPFPRLLRGRMEVSDDEWTVVGRLHRPVLRLRGPAPCSAWRRDHSRLLQGVSAQLSGRRPCPDPQCSQGERLGLRLAGLPPQHALSTDPERAGLGRGEPLGAVPAAATRHGRPGVPVVRCGTPAAGLL